MSLIVKELSFILVSVGKNLSPRALPHILVPSATIRTSYSSTLLLSELGLTSTVPHATLKLAFILVTKNALDKAFTMIKTIEPFSFVETPKMVCHFTEASHFSFNKAALVDVAALERFFALSIWLIFFPLAFIAIAITVNH